MSIFYYSNKKSGTFSEAKICLKFIHHENDQRKLSNATQQIARRAEKIENGKCDLCGKEFYFKHENFLQCKKVLVDFLKVFKIKQWI